MIKLSGAQKKLLKTNKEELVNQLIRTQSLYVLVDSLVEALIALNAKEEKVNKINITSSQLEQHFNVK